MHSAVLIWFILAQALCNVCEQQVFPCLGHIWILLGLHDGS